MACLLFVAWEGVQGDYRASQRHMGSGRALAARFGHSIHRKSSLSNIWHETTQVLERMNISAMSFSDDSAPYQPSYHDPLMVTSPGLFAGGFKDVQSARASLMDITRSLLWLGSKVLPNMDEAEKTRRQFEIFERAALLEKWAVHWRDCYAANQSSSNSTSVLNVQLWYTCARVITETGFGGPETRHDDAAERFRDLVDYAEKLSSALFQESGAVSFSLDLGYLIPTFFAATRCRDPYIRRRALRILQSYPRHEGAWQSGPAAVIAERWVAVEERGLGDVESAVQIPEHLRVVHMAVYVQKSSGRGRLRFQLSGADGASSFVEELVSW
ncbi:hypothetical protein V2A60_006640 [Cordyceps javanica]|uniref:C6 zinc finger domain-containing protein n=1 Tax=Cordyceps javanica TaxID=43265 RepID=A0A545V7B4_9HYPO|nr:hypothetical protein IF1G_03359 [Cordyceps javanica]TQW09203.1 hypothetical protein IF2G_03634 [Cordyceps javanica]